MSSRITVETLAEPRALHTPRDLDRVADVLLQQGDHHQAERLAHRAAELRAGEASR